MTLRNNAGADGKRHGSSSADSQHSVDTIRGPFTSFLPARGALAMKAQPRRQVDQTEAEVSPGTMHFRSPPSSSRQGIAPWEDTGAPDSQRNDSSFDTHPPLSHANAQWPENLRPSQMPSSIFDNDFYNDSSENLDQISPGFTPDRGMTFPGEADHRRPSVASNLTISSNGSLGSRRERMHKKLQGIFGEEFPGVDDATSRQNSETSSLQGSGSLAAFLPNVLARGRNNSMNDALRRSRPPSPSLVSRPRTPAPPPSSEVTPWEYQDSMKPPPPPGSSLPHEANNGRSKSSTSRLHLPSHRANRSVDEKSGGIGFPLRPTTSRENTSSTAQRDTNASAMSSAQLLRPQRPTSPAPSAHSTLSTQQNTQRSPTATQPKRSLLNRLTHRHKSEKPSPDSPHSQSNSSLNSQPTNRREHGRSFSKPSKSKLDTSIDASTPKKESRLPFKHKRNDAPTEGSKPARNPNELETEDHNAPFYLDTDTTNMEGIVDGRRPLMTPSIGETYEGWPPEQDASVEGENEEAGAWDAPESWLTNRNKTGDDSAPRPTEHDNDAETGTDDDSGPMYFMRILRADSTFAVINASLNSTVADIISIMGKKTFFADDLSKYHIVLRKQDTSRQLGPKEKPLLIQKRLLMMAGYQENDDLDDVGREDHGYLCRFTFLPSKMSGYSSLEKDPNFDRTSRLTHVDLTGRNLITIPITLYVKAGEINTLNLSRNLTLDIPKDFIQTCTQLREIRYCSNEAEKLSPNLAFATRLQSLDVSNNRLEELGHAELDKLHNLLSLRLSNNKLRSVPAYFGSFRALRSLYLSSNSLDSFPETLRDLPTLKDLDISFNSISNLGNLGTLVNLERLLATNNKLSGPLDESLANLKCLREIDARFNAITNIDVVSQLPCLETLLLGHNSISQFEGSFYCLEVLFLNHNPVTKFDLTAPVPSLSILNLASAKLSQLPETLFAKITGLTKLTINKNHFVSLSPQFGLLSKLEYLSVFKNELSRLPAEIGRLTELRYLDVHENNLSILPPEIWLARKLETLNVSSNVLAEFPKPGATLPALPETPSVAHTPTAGSGPDFEELGRLEDFQLRRPSQASGMFSNASSPGTTSRKGSIVSHSSNKPIGMTRIPTSSTINTVTPASRKDSTLSGRLAATFASSLRHLSLAENRLEDDVFNELVLLSELRILNLSFNQLYDVPPRTIRRWANLTQLYLSGNDLTSIPSEDLEESSKLRVLHINNNKFQNLPAEIGNLHCLATLDVGSNMLKYNVSNWPYDWNWNSNRQLRFLNLSGNKRLEIKPSMSAPLGRDNRDLTDFSSLSNLRVLGLMDVTLTIPPASVPDQAPDRRVRFTGSIIGNSMPYGMADTLGRNEHLSTLDMVVPSFRGRENEALIGLFDGQVLDSGGNRVASFLYEKFNYVFSEELQKTELNPSETPLDALRRTYLALNQELATTTTQALDVRSQANGPTAHRGSISGIDLTNDDLNSGSVATVIYLLNTKLYISNVGDAQALLIQTEAGHREITRKHDPASADERQRIREAGGFVSRHGKLNDSLEVSRAFGYAHLAPCVIAAPHVTMHEITDSDEMIIIASKELWDYLTPDFAVDVARQERSDAMRAAQRLRDIAIAFGATGKIMVMVVGLSDLRKREKARYRTSSMSLLGPSVSADDYFATVRKAKRGRDAVGDSKLARLKDEVDAPVGDVVLVFTDIKNSTILWETYAVAMQSAIKMHNELMRRQLRIIGGYEVKTEGDAFMVAFPTVTSALLWCFKIQTELLEVEWPQEILSSVHGEEMIDAEGGRIFRGLSVRMGIHWGRPVCEIDPVTKRMDYFGPMVNRAARIESVADGGQICVSHDFLTETMKTLESNIESDRNGSTGSEETLSDDIINQSIRRDLQELGRIGFEVKDLGYRTLKGLENPERVHLMYPHSLASRLIVQQQRAEAQSRAQPGPGHDATKSSNSQLTIDTNNVWDLWNVSLRLEILCSTLENTGARTLKAPDTALIERMKHGGGEITDRFLINLVEHQISRIETCISTLTMRNMMRPFKNGMLNQACPMAEIFAELATQLNDLQAMKARTNNITTS